MFGISSTGASVGSFSGLPDNVRKRVERLQHYSLVLNLSQERLSEQLRSCEEQKLEMMEKKVCIQYN